LDNLKLSIIKTTIKLEGGDKLVNDPADSGRQTKFGISQRAYPNIDIPNLTLEEAIKIYANDYFNDVTLNMAPNIAFKIFDMGVLQGKEKSEKIFQGVLSQVSGSPLRKDGVIGLITFTVYMNYISKGKNNQDILYDSLVKAYSKRLRWIAFSRPKNLKFLKGWMIRAKFLFKREENEA